MSKVWAAVLLALAFLSPFAAARPINAEPETERSFVRSLELDGWAPIEPYSAVAEWIPSEAEVRRPDVLSRYIVSSTESSIEGNHVALRIRLPVGPPSDVWIHAQVQRDAQLVVRTTHYVEVPELPGQAPDERARDDAPAPKPLAIRLSASTETIAAVPAGTPLRIDTRGGDVVLVATLPVSECVQGPDAAAAACNARPGPRRRSSGSAMMAASMEAFAYSPGDLLVLSAIASLLLFLGLGAWAGLLLFSRFVRADVLDHPRRLKVFECLSAEPGLEFGEISRRLEIPNGALQHHLGLLEQHGLVGRYRDGRSTRFYPNGQRLPLRATLSGTRERILGFLEESGRLTAAEVALRLGHRVQSVWHHLRRLEAQGLLAADRQGRAIYWRRPS